MENCLVNYKDDSLKDFTINNNKELVYRYFDSKNNKWSETKRIDYNVTEFKLDVDIKGNIHIIYADNRGMKYAIITEQDFKRTTIFNYNKKYYKMENIKFLINKGRVDIVSTLYDSGDPKKRTLVHYERTMNGSRSKIIAELEIEEKMNFFYDVVYQDNIVKLFINKGKGKENEIFLCKYLDSWSGLEKIYSYQGKVRDFIVREFKRGYVILKVSDEYSLNVITREIFDAKFKIIEKSRYSSSERISDPLMVVAEGQIWGFWKEKGQLLGGNLSDEVILPRRISGSSGTIKMDYIVVNEGNIKRQNLFGINNPRKPFLIKEVFNEDLITWKFEEEFYKGKEDIINKLFGELKKRDMNLGEMMKRGREIEGLAHEREKIIKDMSDRYSRMLSQNKNLMERLKGISGYRELVETEKKEMSEKLQLEKEKVKMLESDLGKVLAEGKTLKINNQKLVIENKDLKESIKVKDFMMKEQAEIDSSNKKLIQEIKELKSELSDMEKSRSYEKEIRIKEKEKYQSEIENLNKIIQERENIERLLSNMDTNKNEGFLKRIFRVKEKND